VAARAPAPELNERDLQHWRLIEEFGLILERVLGSQPAPPSFVDPRRRLAARDYLSLYLFGLFNPVVRTMRGLCQASHLARVRSEVCTHPVSLGSFSEAQHGLDFRLLEQAFKELSAQVPSLPREARLGQWQWLAQDGSLFAALPRMAWALYGAGRQGAPNRAVRLHLSLDIVDDKPAQAAVRMGKVCERKVWREQWQPGQAYVGDRGFGQDYKLLGALQAKGCAYVLRLREHQCVVHVLEDLAVSEADRRAGVVRQAWAYLGCKERYRSVRVRVVWIPRPDNLPLMLVTNLPPEELPAELVSLLYRQRWKIELFFRWVKCILGCRHWLAESPAGAAIQIYLALIAALLLQLYTGRKPNKRMMELLQWHQLGIATDQELAAGLQRERQRLAVRKKL
jgi:hypothetical protein